MQKKREYSWRNDKDKNQCGRLENCLVTPNLMVNIVNFEHQATTYSDHSTLVLEIETNMERQGRGILEPPPRD